MALVTIRGSNTPCVELLTGEVAKRIYLDEHVQRLIDRGWVEVLEWIEDKPKPKRELRAKAAGSSAKPKAAKVTEPAASSKASLEDSVTVELSSDSKTAADELVEVSEELGLYGAGGVGGGKPDPVDVVASGLASGGAVHTPDQTTD